MKKPFPVIILILFFSCAFLHASQAGQPAGPRMSIEENYFNFQEVTEGSVLAHTFKVLNTGDQPLKIKKVSPG